MPERPTTPRRAAVAALRAAEGATDAAAKATPEWAAWRAASDAIGDEWHEFGPRHAVAEAAWRALAATPEHRAWMAAHGALTLLAGAEEAPAPPAAPPRDPRPAMLEERIAAATDALRQIGEIVDGLTGGAERPRPTGGL